jgi:hypothetical protein
MALETSGIGKRLIFERHKNPFTGSLKLLLSLQIAVLLQQISQK